MKNEELKKKIAKIIADYFCPQRNEHKNLWGEDRLCYSKMNFAECERIAECTDALIGAGIGDVSEYKHRAEVAERALRDELVQKAIRLGVTDICPWYIQALNEAEKKLAEERKDE